jgi:hypothetical protein
MREQATVAALGKEQEEMVAGQVAALATMAVSKLTGA